jgi:hypothetical protein
LIQEHCNDDVRDQIPEFHKVNCVAAELLIRFKLELSMAFFVPSFVYTI